LQSDLVRTARHAPSRSRNAFASANRPLFLAGLALTLAVVALSAYISVHAFIPEDAAVERDIQGVPWGPLTLTFPFYSWIGDSKGFVAELIVFVAILVVNRRAWVVAAGASVTALWYLVLSHLVLRARPTTATVLRVTEHPGASSFPSGHTIFMCTLVVVLILCIGYRFLRGWGRVAAWIAGIAVIFGNVIDRMYTGAHWPTDVVAAVLIAAGWLAFIVSLRPISDGVLNRTPAREEEQQGQPGPSPSATRRTLQGP